MKKIYLLVSLFLMGGALFAQNTGNKILKTEDINLEKCEVNILANKGRMTSKKYSLDVVNSYHNKIYVLGWSKDGNVAFLKLMYYEGKGDCAVRFTVQNIVSDEVVFENEFEYDPEIDADYDRIDNYEKDYLNRRKNLLDSKFEEYRILNVIPEFRALPYKTNGYTFDFYSEQIRPYEDDASGCFQGYRIKAERYDGIEKKTKLVTSDEKPMNYEVVLFGVMESPFEKRLLLFYGTVFYFEGINVSLYTTGCAERVGF